SVQTANGPLDRSGAVAPSRSRSLQGEKGAALASRVNAAPSVRLRHRPDDDLGSALGDPHRGLAAIGPVDDQNGVRAKRVELVLEVSDTSPEGTALPAARVVVRHLSSFRGFATTPTPCVPAEAGTFPGPCSRLLFSWENYMPLARYALYAWGIQ